MFSLDYLVVCSVHIIRQPAIIATTVIADTWCDGYPRILALLGDIYCTENWMHFKLVLLSTSVTVD